MIDTGSVERALGSLERLAPDEEEVLAGFRQRVARRRRRRQVASVAGVAAAATAVAVGVVFALPGADPGGSAAAPPTSSTSTAPSTAPSAEARTVIPGPRLPFAVGWLPSGYSLARWEVRDGVTYVNYAAEPEADGTVPTIMVGTSAARPEEPAGAVSEPTTIGDYPGVFQRMTIGAQFTWHVPDGPWIVVGTRDTMPEADLRRVAESLSLKPTPQPVQAGMSRLPDGYRVAVTTGERLEPPVLTFVLCREGVDPLAHIGSQCVTVQVLSGTAPSELPVRGSKVEMEPLGQEEVVDGVPTRATPDGKTVVAQISDDHWVEVSTIDGDASVLRSVAAAVVVTP